MTFYRILNVWRGCIYIYIYIYIYIHIRVSWLQSSIKSKLAVNIRIKFQKVCLHFHCIMNCLNNYIIVYYFLFSVFLPEDKFMLFAIMEHPVVVEAISSIGLFFKNWFLGFMNWKKQWRVEIKLNEKNEKCERKRWNKNGRHIERMK